MSGRPASLALMLTLVLACAAPNSTPVPTAPASNQPSSQPTTQPTGAPTISDTPTTSPQPTPADLSARPLIWYSPLPPMPGRTGSVDFMDQFTPDAPWLTAAGYVDVYKLYGEWVAFHATDAELQRAVQDILRRGPDLGGRSRAVRAAAPSAARASRALPASSRGADRQPGHCRRRSHRRPCPRRALFFGHLYDGLNACHLPVDDIAAGVADLRYGDACHLS